MHCCHRSCVGNIYQSFLNKLRYTDIKGYFERLFGCLFFVGLSTSCEFPKAWI